MKRMRYKTGLTVTVLSILIGLPGTILAQQKLADAFQHPPSSCRPVPFWHLNGTLTKELIDKQMTDAAHSGFGGVAVLPVTQGPMAFRQGIAPGMSPAYLSEEYFSRYRDILESAKANGMQVILYDDIDFPSGSAGGRLKQLYPEAVRKNLIRKDTSVTGPARLKMKVPEGQLMAVVGSKDNLVNRTDLTRFAQNGSFEYSIPEGSWRVMFFLMKEDQDGLVDYMDVEAANKFVSLTYDQYARRLSFSFGKTIHQTFFDDVGYVTKERGWTAGISKKFKERFGRDAALYYPALWEDIGSDTEAARVAFFDSRAELLAEGYPKVVSEWARQHGLKSSGHPPGNYEIQPVDMNFDVFKFYRHEDIPTMDAIFYHGHGREGFKLISSAADYYGRPVVAAEIYGAFREETFDTNMLYRTAMEIFARGVNFLIPHGMWLDPDPDAVRIPPLISPYSDKLAPELNRFNDFAARTSLMLQGGETVSNIGVLYPIASLQGFYRFEAKDNNDVGKYAPPGTDYLKISDLLTNIIHRDFTFIHPEYFTTDGHQTIILPSGNVIAYETLKKIKQFLNRGGKVIATGTLPSKSAEFGKDGEVRSQISEIFGASADGVYNESIITRRYPKGGLSAYIPEANASSLQTILALVDEQSDVSFEGNPCPKSGNGALSYIHKVKNKQHIYYVANSTDDPVQTYVNLKGKLRIEEWNPYTGEINSISDQIYITIKGQVYTKVRLSLAPVRSTFLVSGL
jgi:hypothetical protein